MKIILTGGGTVGHVSPNIALISGLKDAGFNIYYIGSKQGLERNIAEANDLEYFGISSGKFRRYASIKNITDLFRIGAGFFQSLKILRKVKPDIVFSKGGFVVVPVVLAAWLLRIKCVIHESDITPGLATKICSRFAKVIFYSFEETKNYLRGNLIFTGIPIKPDIHNGEKEAALQLAGFKKEGNPVLLITGGSQGSKVINEAVIKSLDLLLEKFRIIHIAGSGNKSGIIKENYAEIEFTHCMNDFYSAADIVLSRAGASTLFELLTLKKPHLLIPLPLHASRGDQILNAESFKKKNFSQVLPEENLEDLVNELDILYTNREKYIEAMGKYETQNPSEIILKSIADLLDNK